MVCQIRRALRRLKVVLFSRSANIAPRLKNVAALRPDGGTEWPADLPADTGHDCFVKLEDVAGVSLATTFRGHRSSLCPATGIRIG